MAALTADRNAICKEVGRAISLRVAADAVIYNGALVCTNAAGYAVPAADTVGFSEVVGVADEAVDNTGGADGDVRVLVRKGVWGCANAAGGTAVTVAGTGRVVYVADDQTVQNAGNVIAGTVEDFNDDGRVFIKIHEQATA